MADIASKVAQIRQATYGKDVRESIASGIEAINSEVVNTTSRQNVIDSQEASRIANEITRIANEDSRKTQETSRVSNESSRQSQEQIRANNENIRQSQETIRQDIFNTNEADRQAIFSSNENDRSVQFNGLKTQITESITGANTAATNANLATAKYSSVIEQTRKIYKPAVNTYADLSIKYPTPEVGWTATAKDSNIEYRWDGVEWIVIGNSDPSIGFSVVVGSYAPDNTNAIWLDAPVASRYARIIPSITQPTDLGQIWWQKDA